MGRLGPNHAGLPLSVTQILSWDNRIAHTRHLKNRPIWVRGLLLYQNNPLQEEIFTE